MALKESMKKLVEDLFKVREPINLDAIYFLTPTQNSINALINDFPKNGPTRYRAAHIHFTGPCPEALFKLLSKSLSLQKVVSFKEINIDFIPVESQVFSLDFRQILQSYYNSVLACNLIPHIEYLAYRIACVCYVLNEYPSVRYLKKSEDTYIIELAHMVEKQLNMLKKEYPIMGQGSDQKQSELVIYGRPYDFISPILHEFTFQAMAHEYMLIKNDMYVHQINPNEKKVVFDESDEQWIKYRHCHIADLSNNLSESLKKYVKLSEDMASTTKGDASTGALSDVVKELSQHKNDLNKYTTYMNVVRNCMNFYSAHMSKFYTFEQDMVMGEDEETVLDYSNIKDKLSAFLKDEDVIIQNKLRLIMLFVFSMNGVSEDVINKLVEDAQLSQEHKQTILNSNKLCINCIGKQKEQRRTPRQDNDPDYQKYKISRWAPLVKDLMENCIEGKLDPKCFPYVSDRNLSNEKHAASSSRYTPSNVTWHKVKDPNQHQGSRVIVFIVGGVTYSEIKCAYQVSKKYKDWQVIIGSTHILTPDDFIKDLSDLGEHTA